MRVLAMWVARILLCGFVMVYTGIANAEEFGASEKATLHFTLLQFLESGSDDDDAFRVMDRNTGKMITAHIGALHPKIIPFGADYVLCIEMYDDQGGRHDADFILRASGGEWVVVDVLFDQRALLKKALAEID